MRDQPLILAVDDTPENLDILQMRLESQGYAVITAADGEEGMARVRADRPDLVLLDIMMPKRDGISVVREIKADPDLRGIPVILVTAKADTRDVVTGLDAGGDDYLTKPFEHAALMARVRAMLRVKSLRDQVAAQTVELERRAGELAALNATLAERVAAQVGEIERANRLKRFLAPQVVDLVLSDGGETLLQYHRREIVVLFCDLRGFTAFAETAEPEEVMSALREYHALLGPLVRHYEGTLDKFAGDGMMVFFNDPVPCPDPAVRAIRLAAAIRAGMRDISAGWRQRGYALDYGVGVAQGFATLGRIGFEDRQEYTAIGTVSNLAARLCGEATEGQILITKRVATAIEGVAQFKSVGAIALKGLSRPTDVFEFTELVG